MDGNIYDHDMKWDLEHSLPIEGQASRRLQRLIRALVAEGLL